MLRIGGPQVEVYMYVLLYVTQYTRSGSPSSVLDVTLHMSIDRLHVVLHVVITYG